MSDPSVTPVLWSFLNRVSSGSYFESEVRSDPGLAFSCTLLSNIILSQLDSMSLVSPSSQLQHQLQPIFNVHVGQIVKCYYLHPIIQDTEEQQQPVAPLTRE